jgi:hypothetical protein
MTDHFPGSMLCSHDFAQESPLKSTTAAPIFSVSLRTQHLHVCVSFSFPQEVFGYA